MSSECIEVDTTSERQVAAETLSSFRFAVVYVMLPVLSIVHNLHAHFSKQFGDFEKWEFAALYRTPC